MKYIPFTEIESIWSDFCEEFFVDLKDGTKYKTESEIIFLDSGIQGYFTKA
jgi:hypothetical protein